MSYQKPKCLITFVNSGRHHVRACSADWAVSVAVSNSKLWNKNTRYINILRASKMFHLSHPDNFWASLFSGD